MLKDMMRYGIDILVRILCAFVHQLAQGLTGCNATGQDRRGQDMGHPRKNVSFNHIQCSCPKGHRTNRQKFSVECETVSVALRLLFPPKPAGEGRAVCLARNVSIMKKVFSLIWTPKGGLGCVRLVNRISNDVPRVKHTLILLYSGATRA